MTVRWHDDIDAYMAAFSGACELHVLTDVDRVGAAIDAVTEFRTAVGALRHPEEPGEPLVGYVGDIRSDDTSAWFEFDTKDELTVDAGLRTRVRAMLEAALDARDIDCDVAPPPTWAPPGPRPASTVSPVLEGLAFAVIHLTPQAELDRMARVDDWWNGWWPEHRSRLVDTADSARDEERRWAALDWYVREIVPLTLRTIGLDDHASTIEALPQVAPTGTGGGVSLALVAALEDLPRPTVGKHVSRELDDDLRRAIAPTWGSAHDAAHLVSFWTNAPSRADAEADGWNRQHAVNKAAWWAAADHVLCRAFNDVDDGTRGSILTVDHLQWANQTTALVAELARAADAGDALDPDAVLDTLGGASDGLAEWLAANEDRRAGFAAAAADELKGLLPKWRVAIPTSFAYRVCWYARDLLVEQGQDALDARDREVKERLVTFGRPLLAP